MFLAVRLEPLTSQIAMSRFKSRTVVADIRCRKMPKKKATITAVLPVRINAPVETVGQRIYIVRNQRVMLDSALAELYQVPTFRLNEAVKRNQRRFPEDFMFRLTKGESERLISQFAMSKPEDGRGGRRSPPYAFTELGVAMLSSVLNSERAVQMNIVIMRAFVKLRELLVNNKELAARMDQIEATQREQASVIDVVVEEINALKQPPPDPPKHPIGFASN